MKIFHSDNCFFYKIHHSPFFNINKMCLAIPSKIKSIESQYDDLVRMARVQFGGITKEASLEMVPQAQINDYVLVHVGVAISIVNEEGSQKIFPISR